MLIENAAAGRSRCARNWVLIFGLTAIVVAGCRQANTFGPPPPPPVTVAVPLQQDVTTFFEITGRTAPTDFVEVRARVRGFLEKVHFEEGEAVDQGETLFTIEKDEYEAALAAAEARVAQGEAEQERAQAEFDRVSGLMDQEIATDRELIQARADLNRAMANVRAAQADVTSAELNLRYTTIKAPIAGQISRALVDVGNLVGQGEPTVLATIVPWDPIHVYVSVGERDVLNWRRRIAEGTAQEDIPLLLRLADGSSYPKVGSIDYVDNRVDPETGTLVVRAVFDNAERLLVPGIFVRVRVPRPDADALLVPDSALQRDRVGHFLMFLPDGENTARRADVELGERIETYREVTPLPAADADAAFTGAERVIVSGLQRVRPGSEVNPTLTTLAPVDSPFEQLMPTTAPSDNATAQAE